MKNLKKHSNEIKVVERQRKYWGALSVIVSLVFLQFIVDWELLKAYNLFWGFVVVGIVVTVSWWWWTMSLIRTLLKHREIETEILEDLVNDIKDIKKSLPNNVD
jgi:sterol desaturase/sphingolipid hydroxylase (fatty acid hydroxylase superfamily)